MLARKWSWLYLVMLALVIAACSGGAAAPATTAPSGEETNSEAATNTEAAAASGGTVRIGWPGSPDTINPGTAWLEEAFIIFEAVYDTMFDLQFDGSFKPSLAESWEVSDDGQVWTFKIHQGIKFHDGQPLTAKDVAFTYNFYRSHVDFPYLSSYGANFESVEAPDDSTVVITLSEAVPNMESLLVFQYVLPEHIWSQYTDETAAVEFENTDMIGSGPFKMVEYKQNEFVRLAANKEHFDTPPKVDEVVFQTFGNPDALVQALTTGQVDMITEMPNTAVPTLRNAENVALAIASPLSPSIRDIVMNQIAPENCPAEGGVCRGHPALRDRNVRLALAHATDKQNIIDVAMLGLGTPGLTLIPDTLGKWYNNTLTDYAFDIAKANQILDEAGYKDSDGDGTREMPDGSQPLSFRLQWPNDTPEGPRVADLLAASWGQIGIKTQPQAMDPDALTTACCPALDYDIMIWGWVSDPDPNLLLGVLTTDDIATGNNESGYSNPEYDKLYDQQAVTLDLDKRRELVWQMQEIVHDDVAYIIPYYQQQAQAYRTDRFQGWITDQPRIALADVSSLVLIQPVQ